jgi:hypothetical protein
MKPSRRANELGGIKYDGEKPDYSLVPFEAMDEVVKVLTYGAAKYDRFNWTKVEPRRYQAAAMRHISSYMQGEKIDPESGINHLAHAVCSLLFLTDFDLKELKKGVYKTSEIDYNSISIPSDTD